MTECPFIPSIADRPAQPYRPKSLVRSVPAKRANRLRPGLNPRQTLRWDGQATAFNLINRPSNAPETVTDQTDSTLSP
jgi:hypothetical protein